VLSPSLRRWLPIILGVVILLGFVAVGAVVFSVAWIRQNLEVTSMAEPDADAAFEGVRKRFAEKAPLITFDGGIPKMNKETLAAKPQAALTTVHLLAWDPDERRVARFSLPFWLLRLKETPIQFGSYASGMDNLGIQVRARDIERYGPGIIVEANLPRGARALVWAE
jgi:hypothetical protein